VIPLPPGSLLFDAGTGALIRDFGKDRGDFLFLKGGRGGWGNIHFKSSVNQAPRKALPGKPGEIRRLRVELRVLADIGLVGFPNAGKSSLLDRFTNARPKIAPYPFTTKIPNLGVLNLGDEDIVLADIPGLIEGASSGAGLGIRFLKHISRTRALAFLIDCSEENYLDAFGVLLRELEAFSPALARKKRVLIGTKLDLPGAPERFAELRDRYPAEEWRGISVFSGEGLRELAGALAGLARSVPEEGEDGEGVSLSPPGSAGAGSPGAAPGEGPEDEDEAAELAIFAGALSAGEDPPREGEEGPPGAGEAGEAGPG
jgi:GTP-binding protein